MKILLINKFHYLRGGSETYYFGQMEALKALGHEVICFSMQDEKNLPCEQEEFFVSNVDYNNCSGLTQKLSAAKSFIYSKEAARKMEQLIEKERPDIAHIGLLHRQITFSVVEVLKKHNIPTVMTMHDLIFACPNYTMLSKGQVCEKCVEGSVLNCVKNKCVKNSTSKSILGATEKVFLTRKKLYDGIDLYITECRYYKSIMERSKVTHSRIITMSNFLPIDQKFGYDRNHEDYILYFGRFSNEKGIMTLLKAQKAMGCKYRLVVVGAGPIQDQLKEYVEENHLTNTELPGPIYGERMDEIIEKAKIVVVPSEWYENCPYALLQSLAKGKAVIASRIGGLPELIEDGKTGFLFEPGNETDLVQKIEKVMSMNEDQYDLMCEAIAERAYEEHNWKSYFDKLITEYKNLMEKQSEVNGFVI